MSLPLEKNVVTRIPLEELWLPSRLLHTKRGRDLSVDAITLLLQTSVVQFVVADCGKSLDWISENDTFAFWKNEAKTRIVPTNAEILVDNYPGAYCYVASEWIEEPAGKVIVLLEKHH